MPMSAPPGIKEGRQEAAGSERLVEALRPWRRRLVAQQVLRWTAGGLIAGLLLACLVLLISRLIPWAGALSWAIAALIACPLCALGAALWYRPSLARAARMVDRRLALYDRLGTAWELREESAPLPVLQRQDALKQLEKHAPTRSVSLRPKRSFLATLGVIVAALALLVLLPNPMASVLQQRAAFQARLAKQAAAIDRVRQAIDQQTTIPVQQRKQIDQILHDTEVKLQNAKNEAEAQQILAQAQAKLDGLRDPQSANKIQAAQAASSALQGSANPNLNALGQAFASGDKKRVALALQSLASQVSKMSPAQRAQLAQQLEQAANQAGQNPKLQAALHQLAKAVADGNAGEIADASNAVQAAANESAAAQAQSNSVNQASQGLQQAANNLASSTDTSSTTGQGQNQGQNPGQGQGQNPGQGQNQGQGPGQNQGQGQGSGGGGSGGHGKGGANGGNSAGNQPGRDEQVYVPGQVGTGTSTQSDGGNNGVVQQGSSVPYSQVIAQYNQQAHDAIDNSAIPPDVKNLVHDYFDTLEGQQ